MPLGTRVWRLGQFLLLADTVRESGAPNVRLVQVGSRDEVPFRPVFTRVLVDAPCSGLGTLRQHPEIRWRRQPADIAALAVLQARLLAAAAMHVRPGGVLLYATCTITNAENDAVVDEFLAAHPDFDVDDPRPLLPAAAHPLIDVRGALRTFPHRDALDGFFALRMRRRS